MGDIADATGVTPLSFGSIPFFTGLSATGRNDINRKVFVSLSQKNPQHQLR